MFPGKRIKTWLGKHTFDDMVKISKYLLPSCNIETLYIHVYIPHVVRVCLTTEILKSYGKNKKYLK